MIKIKDPHQQELFDRFAELLGPSAYRRMKEGWQGCFRECILDLLSDTVEKFTAHRSKRTGPETKELFSMSGLMAVKEYFKWSNDDCVDRYNADLQIQYASATLTMSWQNGGSYLNIFDSCNAQCHAVCPLLPQKRQKHCQNGYRNGFLPIFY